MDIYNKKLPTIRQLQYFIAICEMHSFRAAADKLGVSQPPLSVQIKELEDKLQVSLFLRNSHNMVLTKEGEKFKSQALEVLNSLCQSVDKIKSCQGNKVMLGMTKTLCFDFIPFFKKFLANFNDSIQLYQHDYTSKELLLELQKGNLDFAVVSDFASRNQQENSMLIYQEPLILVLPESHPCSQQDYVDLNDVTDLPLFWFKAHLNKTFYAQCESVFKTLNHPLIRRAERPDTLSMLLDIALGKGMMLLPQSMTQAKIDGVVYKKLISTQTSKLYIDIYLVWRNNLHANLIYEQIINYFKLL